jgi:hypothetical protein
MFILITHQELLARDLMCRIMDCDHSLGLKEFFISTKFALYLNIFIFCNRTRVMSTQSNGPHYGLRLLSGPEGST